MKEADRYNTQWMLKGQQLIPSMSKSLQADKEWVTFKNKFDEYIKEGKEVGHARALVGDSIENENMERLKNSEKLIGVKRFDKNKKPNIRPSRKTLERQLVPKG
ncbi:MAG: hypothetical protein ACXWTS_02500 [Methylococcaceae bacterium]